MGVVGADAGLTDVSQLGYVVAVNGNGSTIFPSCAPYSTIQCRNDLGIRATLWAQHGSKLAGSYSPQKDRA